MATAPMQTAMEAYTSAYEANARYRPDGKVTNGEEAHKIATEAARGGAAGGLLDLLPLESVMAASRTIFIRQNALSTTVAHEIAHDIERSNLDIWHSAVRFLLIRAKGGKEMPTSAYFDDPRYSKHDRIYFDHWVERGGTPYTGRFYPDGATEILSTGIARLHANPAKFYSTDPEFYFVVSALRKW